MLAGELCRRPSNRPVVLDEFDPPNRRRGDPADDTDWSDHDPVGGRGKLRAILVAVGLLVAALAVSLVVGVAVTVPLILFGAEFDSPVTFLGLAAVGQLAFLLVGGLYVRRAGGVRVTWPSPREWGVAVGGFLAALVLAITLGVLASAAGVAPTESVFDGPIARNPALALGLAALSILLVAPAEELLFRGALQGRLRRAFGPVGAVATASLLFGALHVANYPGALTGALVGAGIVTVGGSVFGTVYEYTGNLAVPIVSHATYNTVLLVAAFLAA